MDTESRDNAAAVAMQDSSTLAGFNLLKSIEALKEKVDAAVKMFKIYDLTTVDDDEDGMAIYLKALVVKLIGSSLVKQRSSLVVLW